MPGGAPPLDLSALLPYVATAIAIVSGVILLLRSAASRYFAVEAPFGSGEVGVMSIGRGEDEEGVGGTMCRVCGNAGSKVCTGCKSVRYCSPDCQRKHWKEHKSKCRKKVSGSAIALIPGHVSPSRGAHKVLRKPRNILFPYDEFVKLFYWDKHAVAPCGLLNCGNSCFANVVLQCLACTRPLVAYLLEGSHSRECRRDDWCFLCELQFHVQRVSSKSQPFSPMSILSRLPSISSNLGYGRQEDAHEFMRFAIDTMQSVCLDEYGGEKALDASTQETTLVQHIFGGHLQSQVKCMNCDMVSNRYENMMDLTVEIQGDAESLENCLDQFTAEEWLDGDNKYKCDGCNGYVKAWKRLTIHCAPNILTIALKRFQSGRFGKLNKRVIFPETLDLGPYMSNAGGNENVYSLYAIVVHLDMLNASFFGHYICYTKDFCGQWYRIDDCKVAKADIEEVLSQSAYMLLYSRLEVRLPMALEPAKGNTPAVAVTSPSADNTKESNSMEILSIGTTFIGSEEKTDMDLDMPRASGTVSSLSPSDNSLVSQSVGLKEQDSSPREILISGRTSISESLDSASRSDELKPSKGKFSSESPESESVSESLERESGIGARAGLVAPFKVSVDFGMDMALEPHLTRSNGPQLNTGICTNSPSVNTISDGKSSTPSTPSPSSRGSSSSKESRPLFSRGFYDRPLKKKPLPLAKGATMGVSATGANGSINGFCDPKNFGNGKGKSELQSSTPSSDHGIKHIILNGESKDNTVDGGIHLFDEGNSSCYGHMETESSLNAGTRPPLPQFSFDRPIEQLQSVNKLGETLENGLASITSNNGTSHSVPLQSRDEMSECGV